MITSITLRAVTEVLNASYAVRKRPLKWKAVGSGESLGRRDKRVHTLAAAL
jgi:hypothetical protein